MIPKINCNFYYWIILIYTVASCSSGIKNDSENITETNEINTVNSEDNYSLLLEQMKTIPSFDTTNLYLDSNRFTELINELISINIKQQQLTIDSNYLDSITNLDYVVLDTDTLFMLSDMLFRKSDFVDSYRQPSYFRALDEILEGKTIKEQIDIIELFSNLIEMRKNNVDLHKTIPIDFAVGGFLNTWSLLDTIYFKVNQPNIRTDEIIKFSSLLQKAFSDWAFYTRLTFLEIMEKDTLLPHIEINFYFDDELIVPTCEGGMGQFAMAEIGPGPNYLSRRMIVCQPFFANHEFSQIGILRHEIGHLLGFRHTCLHQNVPKFLGCVEEGEVMFLRRPQRESYDSTSVMKSFREACYYEDFELRISVSDRKILQVIYGPR